MLDYGVTKKFDLVGAAIVVFTYPGFVTTLFLGGRLKFLLPDILELILTELYLLAELISSYLGLPL